MQRPDVDFEKTTNKITVSMLIKILPWTCVNVTKIPIISKYIVKVKLTFWKSLKLVIAIIDGVFYKFNR